MTMTPEDQLRRLRDVSLWREVPLPDLVPGELEARRRRPVRGVLVLAAAAVVLVVGLGALAGSWVSGDAPATGPRPAPPTSSAPGVIPWSPIPPAPLPPVRTPSLPAACRAADLTVRSREGGGALGSFRLPITVTNQGRQCDLDPRAIYLVDLSHSPLTREGEHAVGDFAGQRHVLDTGGQATVAASFSEACFGRHAAGNVRLGLQIGSSVFRLPRAQVSKDTLRCAPPMLYLQTDLEDARPLRYAALQARYSRPVRTSEGVSFTVSLTNTGRRTITFATCPTYTEIVNVEKGISTESYRLNCATARSIPAGATRRFAMRAKTPNGFSRHYKLGWSLRDGNDAIPGPGVR